MNITDEELRAVKAYMQVDPDFPEDDGIIRALSEAAVLYLRNAGIEAPSGNRQLYDLAVWGLTLFYYDHREAVGNEAAFPVGLRPIITQLKLTAGVDAAVVTDADEAEV